MDYVLPGRYWGYLLIISLLIAGFMASKPASNSPVLLQIPAPGSVGAVPDSFIVKLPESKSARFRFMLNHHDVTDFFQIDYEGLRAIAPGAKLSPYLRDGLNAFSSNSSESVSFSIDKLGPELHITAVEENRKQIYLRGYLSDLTSASSLTINGQQTVLAENKTQHTGNRQTSHFAENTSSRKMLTFESLDNAGLRNSVSILRDGEEVSDAAHIELSSKGLHAMAQLISQRLQSLDKNALKDFGLSSDAILTLPYNDTDLADIFLDSIETQGLTLNLTPTDHGYLQLSMTAQQLDYKLRVDTPTQSQLVSCSGQLQFRANVIPLNRGDRLDITMHGASIDNSSMMRCSDLAIPLAINSAHLSSLLQVLLVQPVQENLVIGALISELNSLANPAKNRPLALSIAPRFQSITVDRSGLRLSLAQTISHPRKDNVNPSFGSRYQHVNTAPQDKDTDSAHSLPDTYNVTLSINFINQALLAAYNAGQSTIHQDYARNDGTLRVSVEPLSPAFLDLSSENSKATLNLYDAQVHIAFKPSLATDFKPQFSALMDFQQTLSPTQTPDMQPVLQLANDKPIVRFKNRRHTPTQDSSAVQLKSLEALVETALQGNIDRFISPLSQLSAFRNNVQIKQIRIARDGFLNLSGDFCDSLTSCDYKHVGG